jgi:hypothetical protein
MKRNLIGTNWKPDCEHWVKSLVTRLRDVARLLRSKDTPQDHVKFSKSLIRKSQSAKVCYYVPGLRLFSVIAS